MEFSIKFDSFKSGWFIEYYEGPQVIICKQEDLRVLKRSSDLLNYVKIGQGQFRLIIETYFVLPYMGNAAILVN